MAASVPAATSTLTPPKCTTTGALPVAATGSGLRMTRVSATGLLEAAGRGRRLSSLDHQSKLRAEYPRSLQNCFDVLPLARHAATRLAHSDAFVTPQKMRRLSRFGYTAP